ncbi:MAG: patatin-like phospholipase family protein, partial [Gaiellaceae bacterium]
MTHLSETATTHGLTTFLPLPKEKRKGVALCMSGGGYRAALFHLGALRRLNELGLLSRIDTFTAVSGGSIMLAQIATFMARRGAPAEPGKAIDGFDDGVAGPLRRFTAKDVRTGAALARLK